MQDSQELVFRCSLVEQGNLLVDEEGVGDPDELDVLRPHHQLLQVWLFVKGQSRIHPELSKVHVEGEVHELLRQLSDRENIERDSHSDWDTTIVRSDSSVITNLEGVEKV